MQAQNRQYKTEIAGHQAQLEALKQQDPEFYEYLQQTDQELLNFGQDDEEEGEEDEEEEEGMENVSDDEQVGDASHASYLGVRCNSMMPQAWFCLVRKQGYPLKPNSARVNSC